MPKICTQPQIILGHLLYCLIIDCHCVFSHAEGSDFTVTDRSLTFSAPSQQECFSAETFDDAAFEDVREIFTINLASTNPRVDVGEASLVFMIVDEDGKLRCTKMITYMFNAR